MMKKNLSVALSVFLATGLLSPTLTVNAAPSINPYDTVQAEIEFERNVKEVFTDEDAGATVVSLGSGNYFIVKSVNFSQGVSKIVIKAKADSAGLIVIHKDGEKGDVVGSIKLSGTDGEYREFSTSVKDLDGADTIAFVQTMGTSLVDSWTAEPGETPDEPEIPDQPENPDQPEIPDQPENPDQPEVPEQPENPDQPEVPEQPENPDQPENPTAVNPYEKVEAETAATLENAKLVPNKQSVLINDGGYIVAKNVDLSKGVSGFKVLAKTSAPKVKLDVYVDGTDTQLGSISVGTDMASESFVKISSDLKGAHDVYFKANGGAVQIDAWQALEGQGGTEEPPVVEPPVGDTVNPYSTVEAEASAELKSAMVTPNKQAVSITKGGYAVAKNVDFSKGVKEFTVNAKASGANRLEARLDKADGDLIANFRVSTDAKDITVSAAKNITGTHDIYFVATMDGSLTFDSWKVTPSDGTEEPPVVEPPVGDAVNPYEKVEAEASAEFSNAMITPNKQAVSIQKGGFAV
ncbi:MAG: carbohydrate-binding protein, partial [Butyrivibrio sp.]|nr:carbohydrate-binding protein [Butyrivibrio sp.]